MLVQFSRYLISTVKQLLNGLIRQVKASSFSGCFKTVTLSVPIEFTAVYIIFPISAQKHRLWVLVRTASASEYAQSMF